MYFVLLLLLLFGSIIEIFTTKNTKGLFYFLYGIMTFMAMFRFGQISDYEFYGLYYYQPESYMRDLGYYYLAVICNSIGVNYTSFVALIAFICMALVFPFFNKTCHRSVFALFLFYTYSYFWCNLCAIREGLALSFFIWGFHFLNKGKLFKYYIAIIIGITFHLSVAVMLFLPLFYKIKAFTRFNIWFIVPFFILIAIFQLNVANYLPPILQSRADAYLHGKGDGILFQILLRAALLISVIVLIPFRVKEEQHDSWRNSYIIGFCIYCLLSFSNTLSGRIDYYFRTLFLSLVVTEYIARKKNHHFNNTIALRKSYSSRNSFPLKQSFMLVIMMIHIVLYVRNMQFYLWDSNYPDDMSIIEVPYISIFNKEEMPGYSNYDF